MRTAIGALALVLAGVGLTPARAAEDAACAGFKWPLARERAALTAPSLPVATSGAAYPALGTALAVTLRPQAEVAYEVAPKRTPKSAPAYGAQLVLQAAPGGTVQVTLSDDAWVDLVQDGKVLRSSAFSGRTGCDGVRKSVRFTLDPGPVTISISDSPVATIRLDMTAAE